MTAVAVAGIAILAASRIQLEFEHRLLRGETDGSHVISRADPETRRSLRHRLEQFRQTRDRSTSEKVLADQLRFFQQAGIVERSPDENSLEVVYRLTNRGQALKAAIDGLNDLAARWHSL